MAPTGKQMGSRKFDPFRAQELSRELIAVAFNPGIIDTDMLRSCFGESASSQKPNEWAKHAVDKLEQINHPIMEAPLLDSRLTIDLRLCFQ